MYVRHTDILIIGRREECLCPSHTSHEARTLHNPEHGSRRPVEAVLVFHLSRAQPLHQPCYVSSLRWASAGWRGQAAPLGSWSSGHCLPGRVAALAEHCSPVPFRGPVSQLENLSGLVGWNTQIFAQALAWWPFFEGSRVPPLCLKWLVLVNGLNVEIKIQIVTV